MPKATLVPCPDCGESGFTVFIQELNGGWQGHCGCGHATRYCKTREAAIAAWNSLPRPLPWTYDTPKVAGWYWMRQQGESVDLIQHYNQADTDGGVDNERLLKQWAGPIAPPVEG